MRQGGHGGVDGKGTARGVRSEGEEREKSLPWREARVIQLVIDLRNISCFTSTESRSCSFLGLLLLPSAPPYTICRSYLAYWMSLLPDIAL